MVDKVVVHEYKGGRFNPRFSGKAMNYLVVSGANPFGPRGGRNGKFVDGVARMHFRSSPRLHSNAAKAQAVDYAIQLAVEEGLELIGDEHEGGFDDDPSFIHTTDPVDSRVRRLVNTVVRPKQAKFRSDLIAVYEGKCCVSSEFVTEVLQAAHIRPHLGEAMDCVINGVLLRADLHLLFDAHLIGVDDDWKIVISPRLSGSVYESLSGKQIRLPQSKKFWPNRYALRWHLAQLRK